MHGRRHCEAVKMSTNLRMHWLLDGERYDVQDYKLHTIHQWQKH